MTAPLPSEPLTPHPPRPGDTDRPALRILPVPDTEPPFDSDPRWDRRTLRAVTDPGAELPLDWGRRRASRGRGPEPVHAEPPSGPPGARRAAWRLVNAYLDVLGGRRPLAQLIRSATPDGQECLRRELSGPPQPARRVRLQSLHVAEPAPAAAEVVVVLTDAAAVWALAIRLAHRDGAWRCAHFQMV